MGYLDSSLLPGEHVVARARVHRVVFTKAAIVAIAGAVVLWFQPAAGAVVALIALAMTIPPYITARTSEFGITDKRVIIKVGLVRRRTIELLLRQIEAISVDQTVAGRLLNYGSVTLSGTGGIREVFHNIARPLEFRRHIQGASVKEDELTGATAPDASMPKLP
jgi:uncharacterized membrane protein YdbT with pleckstrin-like domain